MSTDIFESCVRTTGDFAGVFECDDEAGYFYLYETGGNAGHKIIDSIHILSGQPDFTDTDVSVRWDQDQEKVGLFIRNMLWAVFDVKCRHRYGAVYDDTKTPALPLEATNGFK